MKKDVFLDDLIDKWEAKFWILNNNKQFEVDISQQFIMTQSYYLRNLEKLPLKWQIKFRRKMLFN